MNVNGPRLPDVTRKYPASGLCDSGVQGGAQRVLSEVPLPETRRRVASTNSAAADEPVFLSAYYGHIYTNITSYR